VAAANSRGRWRWPVGGVRGGPCVLFLFRKISFAESHMGLSARM
jgi:hypothetical protein